MKIKIFSKTLSFFFAYIPVTKYLSEAVLYLKRMGGYPLKPHIITTAVAFLQAEKKKCCILKIFVCVCLETNCIK